MAVFTELSQTNSKKRKMEFLSKVPEVTAFFWIIKVLCTTVGETAADFLNINLNFGLTGTSVVTGVFLVFALVVQFKAKKYIPSIYWVTVALVSIFGTLVTDNMTDKLGIPLEVSTIVFSLLLSLTFLAWYLKEKTLSVHSIFTNQREGFYWLTILFTFALGTASGDLMAEGLGLGYLVTGEIILSLIIIFSILWKLGLNSILAFWLIYIMTRPLGASIGDFLTQTPEHGGLELGATLTSLIFVVGIIFIVTYLSITKRDVIKNQNGNNLEIEKKEKGGLWQTIVVVSFLIVMGLSGYYTQQSTLQSEVAPSTGSVPGTNIVSSLGDLSVFKIITQDTLDKLNAGGQSGATTRIDDLEYEWDNAQSRLKSKDKIGWTLVDGKIDIVLRELRSTNPNIDHEKTALKTLLLALN
ncbi:MAG: hypothetical protein JWP09_370 [Candidatus Taylorbacteria bacterium]|nr:hypothetical protein [Candidatus Taylorbacteria bacterium]